MVNLLQDFTDDLNDERVMDARDNYNDDWNETSIGDKLCLSLEVHFENTQHSSAMKKKNVISYVID